MPAARAPATSLASESPTWRASPGSAPASSSARRNTAGAGLAAPATADATAPSTQVDQARRREPSGSEQSQLLATTSRRPRSPEDAQRRGGVREGLELERGQHRARAPPRGRAREPSACGSSSAQRSRRSSSAAASRALQVMLEVVARSPRRSRAAARSSADIEPRSPRAARAAAAPAAGARRACRARRAGRRGGSRDRSARSRTAAVKRPRPTAERGRERGPSRGAPRSPARAT